MLSIKPVRPRLLALAGSLCVFSAGALAQATPYSGNPAAMPGTIQAEHYDRGGQNVGYLDYTSAHLGAAFRKSDRVDLVAATGSATGYVINNYTNGEWLGYTVSVATAGAYDLEIKAASMFSSAFHAELNGQTLTPGVALPNTGSWDTFGWAGKSRVHLPAGRHSLKIFADVQYFNLDAIRITAAATAAAQPSANLLFRSGFDGGALSLLPPTGCWSTGCWQDLIGLDSVSNFTWPGTVWGGGGKFLMLTDPVSINPLTIGNYLYNRLETVVGPKGNQTTVLRQQISRNANGTAPMGTSPMQNEFTFMPPREAGDMYVSYWIKLQPDMVQKMNNLPAGPGISGGGTWRTVFDVKTGTQDGWGGASDNGDYRIAAYVMTYGGGQPYWVLLGDNNAGGGAPAVNGFWLENRNVPVPVGQWFKLEFFMHRSSGSDGRIWMGANGHTIADRRGPNTGARNLPINRIMAPILYAGSAMPIYQWVDDLEIWDGFPRPDGNGPFAAH